MKTLINEQLVIRMSEQGAELSSIISRSTGKEYLWQADPAFWKRHSPVLFPIVGGLWNNEYRHKGITYPLSQHGFARDKVFRLLSESATEIRFQLQSNEDTLKCYPFPFLLEIGYRLFENKVDVLWKVTNTGHDELHFQIGAHPAFNYPDYDSSKEKRGYFAFDKKEGLEFILITEKGCVSKDKYPLVLQEGLLPLDAHSFDADAFIFEDRQLRKVALLDNDQKPYITLHFTAPVVGLWSPPGKNAPFVCIEPWYGRCDQAYYTGEYKDKEWMQHLLPDETFEVSYTIEVGI